MIRIPLGDLTPAAARLLLAFLSSEESDTWNTVLIRSGIHDVQTYVLARLSLEKQGFIVTINGREYVTLHAHIEEPPAGVTSQAGEEVVDTGITQPVNISPFGAAWTEQTQARQSTDVRNDPSEQIKIPSSSYPNSEHVKVAQEAAEVNAMNFKKVPPLSTAWAAVTRTRKTRDKFGL